MDRLDELAIFVRIVEDGSLSRAAHRLRRSPPAVSRALAGLEARLGQRLIERTTRRLAATDTGRALYDRARALLADYERATGPADGGPVAGLLRLTAPVQFGRLHIAPLVGRFLDAHPGVEVELLLHDRNIDLIDEAIDVALRIGPLADSPLSARRVGEVGRLWVASPAYLARLGAPTIPADLVGRHEALLGTAPANRDWRFAGGRRGAAPRLSGRLRVDDVETRLQAARDGRGIGQFLSYQVADDLVAGRLVRLLQEFEEPPLPVHLLTRGRGHRAARVEAFLDFAAAHLRALAVMRGP